MTIRSSSMIFALAIVTLGGVVYSQSASLIPRIQQQPMLGQAVSYDRISDAQVGELGRKITAEFTEASLTDVLKWFSKEKISFVAETNAFKDVRLTLSFTDIPIEQALDAVASIVNGHWQRKGDVFVLRPKHPGSVIAPVAEVKMQNPKVDVKVAPKGQPFLFQGDAKAMTVDPKTGKLREMTPQEKEKFAKEWEAWGKQFGEKFTKEWSEKFPKAFKFEGKEWTPEQWEKWSEEFSKHMEKWGEDFGREWEQRAKEFEKMGEHRAFIYDPKTKNYKPIEPKQLEQLKREGHGMGWQFDPKTKSFKMFDHDPMHKLHKEHIERLHKMGDPMTPQERLKLEKELKELHPKISEEVHKAMREAHKAMEEHMKSLPEADRKRMMEQMKQHRFIELQNAERFRKLSDAERMKVLKEFQGKGIKLDPKTIEELKAQGKFKMMDPKALEELKAQGKLKVIDPKVMHELNLKGQHITLGPGGLQAKPLFESITDAQWELHQKQGYLKPSDLAAEQRKLLGEFPKGAHITVKLSIDGKELTIRND